MTKKQGISTAFQDEAAGRLAAIIESSSDAIIGKDLEGRIVSWNKGAESIYGYTPEEIMGKHVSVLIPPDHDGESEKVLERIKRGERVDHYETERMAKDGRRFFASITVSPIIDRSGVIIGASTIARDITDRKLAEEAMVRQAAQEVLAKKAEEILEIATPVIQIWDGIIAAILIGTLDSQRTQRFMEQLLDKIVETGSPYALLDITGVPSIDTQTARHLMETVSAVRLLGAQVIITGIRPAIAQTLVHLGIDLSGIVTAASISGGIRIALSSLNREIVKGPAQGERI